jgi:hypothetical protein
VIFNDPGMSTQLKGLYSRQEWVEGRTTAVLIATIRDYMGDVHVSIGGSVPKVPEILWRGKLDTCRTGVSGWRAAGPEQLLRSCSPYKGRRAQEMVGSECWWHQVSRGSC